MPALLTPQEAADYLRIPHETLRYWRQSKRGPLAVRVGRHLRYRAEELARWVQEQEERREKPT